MIFNLMFFSWLNIDINDAGSHYIADSPSPPSPWTAHTGGHPLQLVQKNNNGFREINIGPVISQQIQGLFSLCEKMTYLNAT